MSTQYDGSASRRTFLKTVAASSAYLPVCAVAADRVQRSGPPRMKLSLAAYSFNSQLRQGWPEPSDEGGTMDLFDFIEFCAEQKLDAVELTSYYFPNPLTHDYLIAIKEATFRLGLDISGTAIGNDFCVPDGPERDQQLALCRQWIDFAADMGAPVIRIFAGNVASGDSEEQAVERCVAGINACLPHAAQRGVALALENHGGITASPDKMLEIVHRVDASPWFGVNFDSGNFHSADPYADLERIAPYAMNAQIKAKVHPENAEPQEADFARLIAILRAANYRGYVALEYEEADDPRVAIPKLLKTLNDLIA